MLPHKLRKHELAEAALLNFDNEEVGGERHDDSAQVRKTKLLNRLRPCSAASLSTRKAKYAVNDSKMPGCHNKSNSIRLDTISRDCSESLEWKKGIPLKLFDERYCADDPLLQYVLSVIIHRSQIHRTDLSKDHVPKKIESSRKDVLYLIPIPANMTPCGFVNDYWLAIAPEAAILSLQHHIFYTLGSMGITKYQYLSNSLSAVASPKHSQKPSVKLVEFTDLRQWLYEKQAFDHLTSLKALKSIQMMIFFFSWRSDVLHRRRSRIKKYLKGNLLCCDVLAQPLLMEAQYQCFEIANLSGQKIFNDHVMTAGCMARHHKSWYEDTKHRMQRSARLIVIGTIIVSNVSLTWWSQDSRYTLNSLPTGVKLSRPKLSGNYEESDVDWGRVDILWSRLQLQLAKKDRYSTVPERLFRLFRLLDLLILKAVRMHIEQYLECYQKCTLDTPVIYSNVEEDKDSPLLTTEIEDRDGHRAKNIQYIGRLQKSNGPQYAQPLPRLYVKVTCSTDYNAFTICPTKEHYLSTIYEMSQTYITALDKLPKVMDEIPSSDIILPFAPHQKSSYISNSYGIPSQGINKGHQNIFKSVRHAFDTSYKHLDLILQQHLSRCSKMKTLKQNNIAMSSSSRRISVGFDSVTADTIVLDAYSLDKISDIGEYQRKQEAWAAIYTYAVSSVHPYAQVGILLLDQSEFKIAIVSTAKEELEKIESELPIAYEKYLSILVASINQILGYISLIACNLQEAKTWVFWTSRMLQGHPWRDKFNCQCHDLLLMKDAVSNQFSSLLKFGLAKTIDTEKENRFRVLEVKYDALHGSLLSFCHRVSKPSSDQRRIVDDILIDVEESIAAKTTQLRQDFAYEFTNITNLENVCTHKYVFENQIALIEKIYNVAALEDDVRVLREQLEIIDSSQRYPVTWNSGGESTVPKYSFNRENVLMLADSMESIIVLYNATESVTPIKLLLFQALYSTNTRRQIEKQKSQFEKWKRIPLLSLELKTMREQISQFARWLTAATKVQANLTKQDSVEAALVECKGVRVKSALCTFNMESSLLDVLRSHLGDMQQSSNIVSALQSKNFDEKYWNLLPWKMILASTIRSTNEAGSICQMRELLTLQLLQDATDMKPICHSDLQNTITTLELREMCHKVNLDDAMLLLVQSLQQQLHSIHVELSPSCDITNDSAVYLDCTESGYDEEYAIRGLREAYSSLQDIESQLKLCIQFDAPIVNLEIMKSLHEVHQRLQVCNRISTFQSDWLLVCKAARLHEIEEFATLEELRAQSGHHHSNFLKNCDTNWKAFIKSSAAWTNTLRHLLFSKEVKNFVQANEAESPHSTSSKTAHTISSSASKDDKCSGAERRGKNYMRYFNDLLRTFKRFDWEYHTSCCKIGGEIVDEYLNRCIREKLPRLYCLDNQELLQLALSCSHDFDYGMKSQRHMLIMKQVLAKAFPSNIYFTFCSINEEVDLARTLDTLHSNTTVESNKSTDSKQRPPLLIKGVCVCPQSDRERFNDGNILFKFPITPVGRILFWWDRLEEEMSACVRQNVASAVENYTTHKKRHEKTSMLRTQHNSECTKDTPTCIIDVLQQQVKEHILPQSLIVAKMVDMSEEIDHVFRSGSNQKADLEELIEWDNEQTNMFLSSKNCRLDPLYVQQAQSMIMAAVYYRDLLGRLIALMSADSSTQEAEKYWSMQPRLVKCSIAHNVQRAKILSTPKSTASISSNVRLLILAQTRHQAYTSFTTGKQCRVNSEWTMKMGNVSIPLGSEWIGDYKLAILTPITERCLFNIWLALRFQPKSCFVFSVNKHHTTDKISSSCMSGLASLMMRWSWLIDIRTHVLCGKMISSSNLYERLNRLLHASSGLEGFLQIVGIDEAYRDETNILRDIFTHYNLSSNPKITGLEGYNMHSSRIDNMLVNNSISALSIFTTGGERLSSRQPVSVHQEYQVLSALCPSEMLQLSATLINVGITFAEVSQLKIIPFVREMIGLDSEASNMRLEELVHIFAAIFGTARPTRNSVINEVFKSFRAFRKAAHVTYRSSRSLDSSQDRDLKTTVGSETKTDEELPCKAMEEAKFYFSIVHKIRSFLKVLVEEERSDRVDCKTPHISLLRPQPHSYRVDRHKVKQALSHVKKLQLQYFPSITHCSVINALDHTPLMEEESVVDALQIAATHSSIILNARSMEISLQIWRNTLLQATKRSDSVCSNSKISDCPHGVIVYGEVGSGKTVLIKNLHQALAALEKFNNYPSSISSMEQDAKISPSELIIISPALLSTRQLFGSLLKTNFAISAGMMPCDTGLIGKLFLSTKQRSYRTTWIYIDSISELSNVWIEQLTAFLSAYQEYYISTRDVAKPFHYSIIFETTDISCLSPFMINSTWHPVCVPRNCISFREIASSWKSHWTHKVSAENKREDSDMLLLLCNMIETVALNVCDEFVALETGQERYKIDLHLSGISMKSLVCHLFQLVDHVLDDIWENSPSSIAAKRQNKNTGRKARWTESVALRLCCYLALWCLSAHMVETDKKKLEALTRQILKKTYRNGCIVHLCESTTSLYSLGRDVLSNYRSDTLTFPDEMPYQLVMPVNDTFCAHMFEFLQYLLSAGNKSAVIFGPKGSGKTSLLQLLYRNNEAISHTEGSKHPPYSPVQSTKILQWMGRSYTIFEHHITWDKGYTQFSSEKSDTDDMLSKEFQYVFLDDLHLQKMCGSSPNSIPPEISYQQEWLRILLKHRISFSNHSQRFEPCYLQLIGTMSLRREEERQLKCRQRFLRHTILLRMPTYKKGDLSTIFRKAYQPFFVHNSSGQNSIDGDAGISIYESVLRATLDVVEVLMGFSHSITNISVHRSISASYCFNLHHINRILYHTFSFCRTSSIIVNDQATIHRSAAQLIALAKVYRCWVTELDAAGFESWSLEISEFMRFLALPDYKQYANILDAIRQDQDRVRQVLRVSSEKYFNVAHISHRDAGSKSSQLIAVRGKYDDISIFFQKLSHWYKSMKTYSRSITWSSADEILQACMNQQVEVEGSRCMSQLIRMIIDPSGALSTCNDCGDMRLTSVDKLNGPSEEIIRLWSAVDWWQQQFLKMARPMLDNKHLYQTFNTHDREELSGPDMHDAIESLLYSTSRLGRFAYTFCAHINEIEEKDLLIMLAMTGIQRYRIFLWLKGVKNNHDEVNVSQVGSQKSRRRLWILLKDILSHRISVPKQFFTGLYESLLVTNITQSCEKTDPSIGLTWMHYFTEASGTSLGHREEVALQIFRRCVMQNLNIYIVDFQLIKQGVMPVKEAEGLQSYEVINSITDMPSVQWTTVWPAAACKKKEILSQMMEKAFQIIQECVKEATSSLIAERLIGEGKLPDFAKLKTCCSDQLLLWESKSIRTPYCTRLFETWIHQFTRRLADAACIIKHAQRSRDVIDGFNHFMESLSTRYNALKDKLKYCIEPNVQILAESCSSKANSPEVWVIKARAEEYALQEQEIQQNIKEIYPSIYSWRCHASSISPDRGYLHLQEYNWCQSIELNILSTFNLSANMTLLRALPYSQRSMCVAPPVGRAECKSIGVDWSSDVSLSTPDLLPLLWQGQFPYFKSARIWRKVETADLWCDNRSNISTCATAKSFKIPIFIDSTGCFMQRFLTTILAGAPVITAHDASYSGDFSALNPCDVIVISCQAADIEARILRAQSANLPVVLVNFNSDTVARINKIFSQHDFTHASTRLDSDSPQYNYDRHPLLVAKTLHSNANAAKRIPSNVSSKKSNSQSHPSFKPKLIRDDSIKVGTTARIAKLFGATLLEKRLVRNLKSARSVRMSLKKKYDLLPRPWRPWFQIYAIAMEPLHQISRTISNTIDYACFVMEWEYSDILSYFKDERWRLALGKFDAWLSLSNGGTNYLNEMHPNLTFTSEALKSDLGQLRQKALLMRHQNELHAFCMTNGAAIFKQHAIDIGTTAITNQHALIAANELLIIAENVYEEEINDTNAFIKHDSCERPKNDTSNQNCMWKSLAVETACLAMSIIVFDQAICIERLSCIPHGASSRTATKSIRWLEIIVQDHLHEILISTQATDDIPIYFVYKLLKAVSLRYASLAKQQWFIILWNTIRLSNRRDMNLQSMKELHLPSGKSAPTDVSKCQIWMFYDMSITKTRWPDYYTSCSQLRADSDTSLGSGYDEIPTNDVLPGRFKKKVQILRPLLQLMTQKTPQSLPRPDAACHTPVLIDDEASVDDTAVCSNIADYIANYNEIEKDVKDLWTKWTTYQEDQERNIFRVVQEGNQDLSRKLSVGSSNLPLIPSAYAKSIPRSVNPQNGPQISDDAVEALHPFDQMIKFKVIIITISHVTDCLKVSDTDLGAAEFYFRVRIAACLYPLQVPQLVHRQTMFHLQSSGNEQTIEVINSEAAQVSTKSSVLEVDQCTDLSWKQCSVPTIISYDDDDLTLRDLIDYEILRLSRDPNNATREICTTLKFMSIPNDMEEHVWKTSVEGLITTQLQEKHHLCTQYLDASSAIPSFLVFEISHPNHLDQLCCAVSSIVNQHSLIAAPVWFVLCSKSLTLKLHSSTEKLLHIDVRFSKQSYNPLTDAIAEKIPHVNIVRESNQKFSDWMQSSPEIQKAVAETQAFGSPQSYDGISFYQQAICALAYARLSAEDCSLGSRQYHSLAQELYSLNSRISTLDTGQRSPYTVEYNEYINVWHTLSRSLNNFGIQHARSQQTSIGSEMQKVNRDDANLKVITDTKDLLERLQRAHSELFEIFEQSGSKDSLPSLSLCPWRKLKDEISIGERFVHSLLLEIETLCGEATTDLLTLCTGFVPPAWIKRAATLSSVDNVLHSWKKWFDSEYMYSMTFPQLSMLLVMRLRTQIEGNLSALTSHSLNLACLWDVKQFFQDWQKYLLAAETLESKMDDVNGREWIYVLDVTALDKTKVRLSHVVQKARLQEIEDSFISGQAPDNGPKFFHSQGLVIVHRIMHDAETKCTLYPLGQCPIYSQKFDAQIQANFTSLPLTQIASIDRYQSAKSVMLDQDPIVHIWVSSKFLKLMQKYASAEGSILSVKSKVRVDKTDANIPEAEVDIFLAIPILPALFIK